MPCNFVLSCIGINPFVCMCILFYELVVIMCLCCKLAVKLVYDEIHNYWIPGGYEFQWWHHIKIYDVFAWHWGLCFLFGVTQVIQLIISDGTAGEENMFTTDQKLLYCTQYNSLFVTDGENTDQKVYYICRSARTCFTFVLVLSQALS